MTSPRRAESFRQHSCAPVSLLWMSSIAGEEEPIPSLPLSEDSAPPSIFLANELDLAVPNAKNAREILNVSLLTGFVLSFLYLTTLNSSVWHGWTTPEIVRRVSADTWGLYSMALHDSPIVTKACTSATVYTIGDIIAQRSEGRGDLDKVRVLRSMVAGGIGHGPLSHLWYNLCDGFFDNVLHWTAWWVLFPKVVMDQTVWGPIWNNTYIALLGMMKRHDPSVIWADIRRSTVPLVVAGLKLWPAAHLVTYGLIPVENRVLWVDFVEIAWVTILASQASSNDESEQNTEQLEVNAAT